MTDQSSAAPEDVSKTPPAEPEEIRFPPEEEQALVKESDAIKAEANTLYLHKDYENALSRYEDALSTCPSYLHYERAVLQSNMAACHLQLQQWPDAIKTATKALDGLIELAGQPPDAEANGRQNEGRGVAVQDLADDSQPVDEEIVSSGASRAEPQLGRKPREGDEEYRRRTDVQRIRTKALLRRARARAEAGGWQNLAGAEEDYKALAGMPGLGVADSRTVRAQLVALPPRTKAAQEKEMSEMWGKLKTLGDGLLKPFGLSTNNFQMVKDEKSGGYSMNFTSGDGSSDS